MKFKKSLTDHLIDQKISPDMIPFELFENFQCLCVSQKYTYSS